VVVVVVVGRSLQLRIHLVRQEVFIRHPDAQSFMHWACCACTWVVARRVTARVRRVDLSIVMDFGR